MSHSPASLAYGVVVAAILLATVWWVDNVIQEKRVANHRARVFESVDASRALLSAGLNARLHLVRGLAAFASSRQDFTTQEFETFARQLQGKQTGIRSLQLAPDAVVTHIYPRSASEDVVGLDLLANAAHSEAVQRTINSRGFVVAGPLELAQGGRILIGRLPIFAPGAKSKEAFWGFATIIIDFTVLIAETELLSAASSLRYALREKDTQDGIFFGDENVFDQHPVVLEVVLPSGSWQLAAVPQGGWAVTWPGRQWLGPGSFVVALGLGCLGTFLAAQPGRLRETAERATRLAEQSQVRFKNLLEGSLQGFCIQHDGHILFANQAFADMFGYALDGELMAVSTHMLIAPHDRERLLSYHAARASGAGDAPGQFEFDGIRRDGSLMRVLASAQRVEWDGQAATQTSLIDISDKAHTQEALKSSRELLRAIVDTMPAMVSAKDQSGRYVMMNKYQAEKYGVEIRDAIGRTASELIGEEQGGAFEQNDQLALNSGQQLSFYEDVFISAGGEKITLLTTKIPLPIIDGGDSLVATVSLDINERKRAEREQNRLIQQLAAKNNELEQFTYTVSHDLKSPLITIRGFAGLLKSDLEEGNHTAVQSDLLHISETAGRMQTLLDDLLKLSRIGRLVDKLEAVALNDVISDAVKQLVGPISQNSIRVKISPDLPRVTADRSRLTVVFQNLIENSVKFMGDQSDPQIDIGATIGDDSTICYVRDNGIGIDCPNQEQIFGLFKRLNDTEDGTGIGLALVQRIVDVHDGRVWVESDGIGMGSTFYVALPHTAAPPPQICIGAANH